MCYVLCSMFWEIKRREGSFKAMGNRIEFYFLLNSIVLMICWMKYGMV